MTYREKCKKCGRDIIISADKYFAINLCNANKVEISFLCDCGEMFKTYVDYKSLIPLNNKERR